jgi:uncharacterized protein (TIGR03000 family)
MRTLILVALATLFLIPADAQAQGRGRGGRGGYYNGGYSGGSYWNRNPGWGYSRNGWGSRWGWGGIFGGIYTDAYSYPSYPYSYSYVVPGDTSSLPRTSLYFEPGVSRGARLEIRLPNASDELIVQGQVMPGYGLTREFISPELTPGKDYVYTISIRRANSSSTLPGDTRSIDVKSGGSYTLDFTRTAAPDPLPR